MSDYTHEQEERAYCAEYVWDAGGWDRKTVDQFPFNGFEPETEITTERIIRWFDFIDR